MARTRTRTRKKKKARVWLDHRALVLSETVLAIGLIQEALEAWVLGLDHVPPVLRVLAAIAVVAGTLGGMMLALRQYVQKGLHGTHAWMTSRLPGLVAHGMIVFALFFGYAVLWNEDTAVFASIANGLQSWLATLLAP